MKAPNSFWNLGFWCDFHRDHGHKTEDCVALKIEVNELLKKGHLRVFLSEKAKVHLSKETTGKPTEAAPVSPPRPDRVIHVISGGSEISGISHAAAKKSNWNAKHSLEAAKPKCLLLGTDEISFTAKEQEKVLTPHHDALAAYKDLGLEESALTRRITPLIGFSGEVKKTAGEVATERNGRSVITQRPSLARARSLRSDRAERTLGRSLRSDQAEWTLGRYETTKLGSSSVAT
ncbi:hypothetical protein F2Q69_00042171 [Brassica cretica]|uniref:Uncharacterized protein n=1 Tax=Brassica cretica TaxID=69181 RepID=A0A8S9NCG2_BRACR|nr:hypothetical protein F2Q69_00042171 [Brassica cretica]